MLLKDLIAQAHSIVPKISCESFSKSSEKFFVIDVREETEIQETGSIVNAVNIPRGLIEMKLAPKDYGDGLNVDTPITSKSSVFNVPPTFKSPKPLGAVSVPIPTPPFSLKSVPIPMR